MSARLSGCPAVGRCLSGCPAVGRCLSGCPAVGRCLSGCPAAGRCLLCGEVADGRCLQAAGREQPQPQRPAVGAHGYPRDTPAEPRPGYGSAAGASATPGVRLGSPERTGTHEPLLHSSGPGGGGDGGHYTSPPRPPGHWSKFGTKRLSAGDPEAPKTELAAEKRAKVGQRAAETSVDLDSTLESDQVLRPPPVAASTPHAKVYSAGN